MCGIGGLYHYQSGSEVDPSHIEEMCRVIRHRGPDAAGQLTDGPFGFGMTRLSINDLVTGNQPLYNEDRSIAVVCNGEIYNHPELRSDLEMRGHDYSTRSDVESILHLYEEHGLDFAGKLRGMFALAVWDRKRRRLVLARDRLGIKPLHYFDQNGSFGFASEIKSLLSLPFFHRVIDPAGLDAYLSLSYIPAPLTIFRGIRKVPPATLVVVEEGSVRHQRYWRLEFPEKGQHESLSKEEAERRLLTVLRDAVRSHLLSDVELGVFLSGGVDSSLVLALMAEELSSIKTFSIGFAESSYSETPFARIVAEKYGAKHRELVVEPHHATEIGGLVSYLDEPFADLSAVPVYFLSGLARSDVKVVLSGDGGDEVFAGYLTYLADRLARYYRMLPGPMRRRLVAPLVRALPTSYDKVSFDYKAKRFVEMAEHSVLRSHVGWKEIFTSGDKENLYSREYQGSTTLENPFAPFESVFGEVEECDFLDRMLYLDTSIYLADDILTKVDRMSMAHSLEVRVPLLDHRVVEFAAGLSPGLKLNGIRTKYILKRALRGLLPREILRRKKAGFIFPAPMWLRGALREFAGDYLSPQRLERMGMLDSDYVARLFEEHQSGEKDRARPLWNLVVLSAWHQHYMEGTVSEAVEPQS